MMGRKPLGSLVEIKYGGEGFWALKVVKTSSGVVVWRQIANFLGEWSMSTLWFEMGKKVRLWKDN